MHRAYPPILVGCLLDTLFTDDSLVLQITFVAAQHYIWVLTVCMCLQNIHHNNSIHVKRFTNEEGILPKTQQTEESLSKTMATGRNF